MVISDGKFVDNVVLFALSRIEAALMTQPSSDVAADLGLKVNIIKTNLQWSTVALSR